MATEPPPPHYCDTVSKNKNLKKGKILKNHEYFMKTRSTKNKDHLRKIKQLKSPQKKSTLIRHHGITLLARSGQISKLILLVLSFHAQIAASE